MTPEIWQDMLIRMRNLRGDMIGQWQGDIDNRGIEVAIGGLGATIQAWETARPVPPAVKSQAPAGVLTNPGAA